MYKLIREGNLPSWLKVLINIALTVTVVYWLGYFIYKILNLVRLFLHTMTKKEIYWVSLGIIFICAIITLFILEFNTDIKPFTQMWEWLCSIFNVTRDKIADVLHS